MNRSQWDRVSVATAARLLGVPRQKVLRLLRTGELEGEKFGHVWQIPRREVTKQLHLPFEKYQD